MDEFEQDDFDLELHCSDQELVKGFSPFPIPEAGLNHSSSKQDGGTATLIEALSSSSELTSRGNPKASLGLMHVESAVARRGSRGDSDSEDSEMDYSKPRQYEVDLRDGIDCTRIEIPANLSETTPMDKAARTIAHCLREHKQSLIKSVVSAIGVKRAVKILKETKLVQDSGGMETNDKKKPKRSPGGVYLRLLKRFTSKTEMKIIFADEKTLSKERFKRRKAKLKKNKEKEKQNGKVLTNFIVAADNFAPKNLDKRFGIPIVTSESSESLSVAVVGGDTAERVSQPSRVSISDQNMESSSNNVGNGFSDNIDRFQNTSPSSMPFQYHDGKSTHTGGKKESASAFDQESSSKKCSKEDIDEAVRKPLEEGEIDDSIQWY